MLQQAYAYKRWADDRALAATRQIDAALHAGSVAFIRQQFNHMLIVEELFQARLAGAPDPHDATNSSEVPLLDELAARSAASNDCLQALVAKITALEQREVVSFQFADGKAGSMTRIEILFHVLNHGSYHRGAISHALDRAGVAHPVDGYAAFIHSQTDAGLGAERPPR